MFITILNGRRGGDPARISRDTRLLSRAFRNAPGKNITVFFLARFFFRSPSVMWADFQEPSLSAGSHWEPRSGREIRGSVNGDGVDRGIISLEGIPSETHAISISVSSRFSIQTRGPSRLGSCRPEGMKLKFDAVKAGFLERVARWRVSRGAFLLTPSRRNVMYNLFDRHHESNRSSRSRHLSGMKFEIFCTFPRPVTREDRLRSNPLFFPAPNRNIPFPVLLLHLAIARHGRVTSRS